MMSGQRSLGVQGRVALSDPVGDFENPQTRNSKLESLSIRPMECLMVGMIEERPQVPRALDNETQQSSYEIVGKSNGNSCPTGSPASTGNRLRGAHAALQRRQLSIEMLGEGLLSLMIRSVGFDSRPMECSRRRCMSFMLYSDQGPGRPLRV